VKNLPKLLLLVLLFPASFLAAQEVTGRVTDSSGAVVRKAQITVHNQNTGVDVLAPTTSSGDYTIPYLKSGLYSVTVSAQGFETISKTDITLQVGQTAVINFALKVGKVSETVTVKADEALLDFGKGDHGEVVENTRVTELPLNGRDPNMLALLNAGVSWTGNIEYQRPFDDTMQNLSINGGGVGNNELMLDGVSNEAPPSNGGSNSKISYVPPVDAVQEFKIVTNAYDAQYGRAAGGALDEVLKSGTNRVHGDVYEFARRTWLNANTWQNNWLLAKGGSPAEYARPQQSWNQYGAELDGPVVIPKVYNGRDKSFFLLQYENFKEVTPSSTVTSVPDPAWVNGDFSNLTWYNGSAGANQPIWIYDPFTLSCNSSGNCTRQTFAAEAGHPNDPSYNKIPSNLLNPVAQKVMSYYPKPNTTPSSGTNPFGNNYAAPTPQTERYRNVLAKWDQNVTSLDRFTLRYGYWERVEDGSTNGMPGPIAEGNFPHGERAHTFSVQETHTFHPNLLLDFRAMVGVRTDYSFTGPAGFDETSLGWPPSMVEGFGYTGTVFPYIQPSEFAYIGSNAPGQTVDNSLNLFPSITWVKGQHTIHAGLDARFLQYVVKSNGGGPYFWVDRTWSQSNYIGSQWTQNSGNSFASLLLGTASSGNWSTNAQAFWSQHYWAPFVQDDWKVTPKLTLNLGIRYDLNIPQTERHNRAQYVFDQTSMNPVNSQVPSSPLLPNGVKGGITYLGVNGNPRSLYSTVWTNIQPRVAFAYALDTKTVLRGGIGEMFSNPTPGGNLGGYSAQTNYDASDDGYKTPTNNFSHPFTTLIQPTGNSLGMLTDLGQGGNNMYFLNPNFKIPSYWSYSVGVQKQLATNDTLEVSYVGSKSFNNNSSDNINRETAAYQAQCNVELGGNPNICNNDYPANPFYQVAAFNGSGNYYSAKTLQGGNFTRAFPAFGDITEWQLNDGHTWYNSLQVTGMHRWNKTLTLHGTWTWSKLMDSGGWTDETYRVPSRSLDGNDRTHRITISGVYLLPVGRGEKFLGAPQGILGHVLDGAVGGWELAASYIYETGSPWGVPNNPSEQYVHSAKVQRHIDPSTGYIRGVAACASQWAENNNTWSIQPLSFNYTGTCAQTSFLQVPTYGALTNTVYTGIRIPSNEQFDSNLSKNFGIIRDALKLQLRLEAFNTFNHPLWQENYEGSTQDSNFGTIEKGPWGQSNLPREVQIAVKLMW
jgi:hypothetical protein